MTDDAIRRHVRWRQFWTRRRSREMDRLMQEEENGALDAKPILLAIGGAALAALVFVLTRREERVSPAARAEAVVSELKERPEKTAKAVKGKQQELAEAAERDLKAAAWDAQQRAKEAEHRLRAAGLKVVDDASHIASRVGAEARSLAGEGRERLSHLRQREGDERDLEREVERLRNDVEALRKQIGLSGERAARDLGLTSLFARRGGPFSDVMASQAAAAALSQLERSFKAKAPALLAAKNRAQVMEVFQQELGPTLRDAAVQAAAAALGLVDTAREEGMETAEARVRQAADELRDTARESAREAREAAQHAAEAVHWNGKRRFWRSRQPLDVADIREAASDMVEQATEASAGDEGHRMRTGLLWTGAGLGLALYALLDPERREQALRLANEASVQIQVLVRDLQGYDDEF
jgi:hypothetical protein